jgi:hypothetical protein
MPPHCQQTGRSVRLYSVYCCIPAVSVVSSPPSIVFFLVRFVGAVLSKVTDVPITPERKLSVASSIRWGELALPECPDRRLLNLGWRSGCYVGCFQLKIPTEGLTECLLAPQGQLSSYFSLHRWMYGRLLYWLAFRVAWLGHGELSGRRRRQIPAGITRRAGSFSSAKHKTLLPSGGCHSDSSASVIPLYVTSVGTPRRTWAAGSFKEAIRYMTFSLGVQKLCSATKCRRNTVRDVNPSNWGGCGAPMPIPVLPQD